MSGPYAEDVRGTHAAWTRGRAPYAEAVDETPEVPEQVYLDAAQAADVALFPHRAPLPEATARQAAHVGFRAAVESAYRAGYQAGSERPRWGHAPDRVEVSYVQSIPDDVKAAVLESAAEAYRAEYGKPDPTS